MFAGNLMESSRPIGMCRYTICLPSLTRLSFANARFDPLAGLQLKRGGRGSRTHALASHWSDLRWESPFSRHIAEFAAQTITMERSIVTGGNPTGCFRYGLLRVKIIGDCLLCVHSSARVLPRGRIKGATGVADERHTTKRL